MDHTSRGDCYSEYGGLRWGNDFITSWNATIPFCQILVTRSNIVLIVNSIFMYREFLLSNTDIISLSIYKALFSSGIRFHHSKVGLPKFLVFWTKSLPELHSKLIDMGYSLNGTPPGAGDPPGSGQNS